MKTDLFDYALPEDRIAQTPAEPRDSARLMVLDRRSRAITHRQFRELPLLLRPGDILVANDTRVLPVRLHGRKATGGGVEVLLLRPVAGHKGNLPASPHSLTWEALVRGKVRLGTQMDIVHGGEVLRGTVAALEASGVRVIEFEIDPRNWLERVGELPLPPYIRRQPDDAERYQTVYARVAGSAAAPTAGLHFTPRLLAEIQAMGVDLAFVTLHIGLDTFRPLEADEIERHAIHTEWCSVPAETVEAVRRARAQGGRCVAVGTTAVRALETAAAAGRDRTGPSRDSLAPFEGSTGLYITPGYEFKAVDALITNFHLPKSSLLVLVAAFAGREPVLRAYREAIEHGYRFYSFGDAMLIS